MEPNKEDRRKYNKGPGKGKAGPKPKEPSKKKKGVTVYVEVGKIEKLGGMDETRKYISKLVD